MRRAHLLRFVETGEAGKALPMPNGVYGCPSAGFAGAATGRHYAEHVKEFRDEGRATPGAGMPPLIDKTDRQ